MVKTYKLSYYVLYALSAIIAIVIAMFFFGGEATGDAVLTQVDAEMSQPAHTDTLLYLIYGLLGLCLVVTIVAFLVKFAMSLKDSPKRALRSLLGFIMIVLVLVVTWSMGSEEPLVMPGYDGTENVPFWLKLTDMFLYTIYLLFGLTVVLIIGNSLKKMIGK